jgi:uncharacterized repeat protein (TIGR03803 family)
MNQGMRVVVRMCLLAITAPVFSVEASAEQTATPVFLPGAGVYRTTQNVELSDVTPGATIFYTTDGSTPTTRSTAYSGPVMISNTTTLRAIAVAGAEAPSAQAVAIYRIVPFAAKPVFSPAQGAYQTPQPVTISDATSGATIYYTTDGSTPTSASPRYMGAITVGGNETLQAIALAPGYSQSPVARAMYEIAPFLDVLHDFGAHAGDGTWPGAPLIEGSDGNLYGTTTQGGLYNLGTVFRITPTGNETTLYSFGVGGDDSADGFNPNAALVEGSDGDFYGTTSGGGVAPLSGYGTVFKITKAGIETVLHAFGNAPLDGADPNAALIQGSDGNFYGTTTFGGTYNRGTVFKITPAGVETVLYSFNGDAPFADGLPYAGLIDGGDGFFYGTTGVYIYKITPAGKKTTISQNPPGELFAGLVLGKDGVFYGTTQAYGLYNDWGGFFKVTRNGVTTRLYSFGTNGTTDGKTPVGPPVQGLDGNFYGTTEYGGSYGIGLGTVYKITPAGDEAVIYSFADDPLLSWVISGGDGHLYGTAYENGPPNCFFMGNPTGCGTVFKLSVGER